MASYLDFKNRVLGRKIDVDGFPAWQPYQCWDVVAGTYFPYIGGHVINCRQSGYVKDIANQRNSNGILDFCVDVGLTAELQPGDICVWTNCPACPSSHIAIYDHDDGQNAVYFLGQNQSVPYVTVARIPVGGIVGVFRPKIFTKSSQPTPHKPKTADQILSKGSKVKSNAFYVEAVRVWNDTVYNHTVGGWIPAADLDEIDASDGANDQILNRGSKVMFNKGTMTVTNMRQVDGVWLISLDKLGYEVLPDCLYELED